MSEEKMSERRRFGRKELNTEVKYTVLFPASKKSIAKNISEGGLCLLLNEQLKKGSILQVEFDLPGEYIAHVEAVVKVMWQERQAEMFLTGVEFLT